ncbi:dihydrofolate reductase [Serratia phage SP1]|nr:dihydrofolate reductase [Serratia phage SP1]
MIQIVFATSTPQSNGGLEDLHFAFGFLGGLPWRRISQDMMNFKERTASDPVIMGRKTFESLPRPLANRYNVVVTTKDPWPVAQNGTGADHVINLDEMNHLEEKTLEQVCREIEADNGTVSIIGGKDLIIEAMKFADRIVHTVIEEYRFLPNDVKFTSSELPFRRDSSYSGWKAIETHWYDTQGDGPRPTYISETVYERTK